TAYAIETCLEFRRLLFRSVRGRRSGVIVQGRGEFGVEAAGVAGSRIRCGLDADTGESVPVRQRVLEVDDVGVDGSEHASLLDREVRVRVRGGRGAGAEFGPGIEFGPRSEEHTSELQSRFDLVCRLLLE